jgi:hypothetical protein
MRFEELAYAVNGLPVTVRLSARLTIVSVDGAGEPEAWIARVLGVLEGLRCGDGASVVTVDRAGRPVRLERDDQGAATLTDLATGAELPYAAGHLSLDGRFDWFASVGLSSKKARDLMVVDGAAFTGDNAFDVAADEAELNEARERLAQVEGQRRAAITSEGQIEDLLRRIADLDEQLRQEAQAQVLRRQADATEAIQRLESELAAAQGVVPPERDDAEAVLAAVQAVEEWRRAAGIVADTWRAFGRRPRMDREAQDRALGLPAEIPTDLETLVAKCRAQAELRDELVARLYEADADTEEVLRRELVEDVEPAYVDALAGLAGACRPFGVIIDAARIEAAGIDAAGAEAIGTQAVAEVTAQAAEATQARLQQALEDAESECQAAQERVELGLAGAGVRSGGTNDLAARVDMLMARAGDAMALLAPTITRPLTEVEADLARARAELAACSPPDWDEAEPDVDHLTVDADHDSNALVAERTRLLEELECAERDLPDVDVLAEQHADLERRVASLEESVSAGCRPAFSDAEKILAGRAARARRVGRSREPFPLMVNDALAAFPADDKSALLDVLTRLGETTQIIYLTDDPDTLAWASGRDGTDEVTVSRPDAVSPVAEARTSA